MASDTPVAPSPLSSLRLLSLLEDEDRAPFLHAVSHSLRAAAGPDVPPSLEKRFGLDFAEGEPAALLLGAKFLAVRIASRTYQEAGEPDRLRADLATAGLSAAAAAWLVEVAEAAVLPHAPEMRTALSHARQAMSHDYLVDFDWQARATHQSDDHPAALRGDEPLRPNDGARARSLPTPTSTAATTPPPALPQRAQLNYVLSSSALARVRKPLVQLQLAVRKARTDELVTETIELSASELDATIDALSSASDALQALPGAGAAPS